jgi:formate dehydrogenase subunit gamma
MIERYTFRERICHWFTGLTYSYCLATGLAFYTPHLFWIAIVLGGAPTSRFLHPMGGLLFVIAAIWMHELWRSDMTITPVDRAWLDKSGNYATNNPDIPPQDRFNAGQKVFYWVMFYGALFLLLSGLVMWFPERVPAGMYWLRGVAILVHESAALVTIGAFIIHVYMGVFMVKGSVDAIVTGRVSESWAKAHHRLWFERITARR